MRTEGQILQKLKQAQYRHVKRVLIAHFKDVAGDWPSEEVDRIKSEYREFFANSPVHVIAKDFPDVAALMWVLKDQPEQVLVPNGSLVGKIGGVPLWADTEEQAILARDLIDHVFSEATKTQPEVNKIVVEQDPDFPKMTLADENGALLMENGVVPGYPDGNKRNISPEGPVKRSWWQKLFG